MTEKVFIGLGPLARAFVDSLPEKRCNALAATVALQEIALILRHGATHCDGIDAFVTVDLPDLLHSIIVAIGGTDDAYMSAIVKDAADFLKASEADSAMAAGPSSHTAH